MNSKIYTIPDVGEIEVCKHHKTRRLSIKLRHGKKPKVVIPKLMSYRMGLQFAVEKSDWIAKHLNKLAIITPDALVYNEQVGFKTRFFTLSIVKELVNEIKVKCSNDDYVLVFPEKENIEADKNQLLVRNFIVELLKKKAKEYLPNRLLLLATKYSFKYNNLVVKNIKSRWGSCSSVNNINLNIHLIRLPEYLSDFIILHELCHTIHKNHGCQFHELLNNLVDGNEKVFNRELRNFRIEI